MNLYKINVSYIIHGDPDKDIDDQECAEESMVAIHKDDDEAILAGYGMEVEWNMCMLYDNPVDYLKFQHMMDTRNNTLEDRLELRKAINHWRNRYYQFDEDIIRFETQWYSNGENYTEYNIMVEEK